ncbi:hypothetical protein B0H34DRAFT_658150 [Crassisporium funariophilum]|nr:hypothetical protein B0H34DRAFT_658150 [Crassisporium funariophilum]
MGNLSSRKFDPLTDLVDLKGKVVIITGGNAGIGFATVQHLARAGAKVYLAARNESRAIGAIARLEHEGLGPGNGQVVWLKLDLCDPREAKKAAEDFLTRENRLDVIGDYISPFVFTRTLLPLLQQTAKESDSDVRIVNLTSITHKLIPSSVKFDEISDFNITYSGRPLSGLTRYAHGKFMVVIWTKTLQRRVGSDSSAPITVISVHPGGVDTFTHKWRFSKFFKWLVGLVIAQPAVGAYNSAFAAAGKKVRENREAYQGVYLESQPTGKFTHPNKAACNEALGDQLWTTTEAFLKSIAI